MKRPSAEIAVPTRRAFLAHLHYPVLAAAVGPWLVPRAAAIARELAATPGDPDTIARDEAFWSHAQQAFPVDRSIVNLNNGGVSPCPRGAAEAFKRYFDISNLAPAHTMWKILEPQKETVRARLARLLGCEAEEVAITRNASEGLHICQLGFDVRRGDELLTTTQDYPRMVQAWRQRERREGAVLRTIQIPVPAEDPAEVVRRFEEAITPRTRTILASHVINLTGQILPVREIVQMARRHGIPVIVDGAHSFAHFPFTRDDLDCEYFATSLHKWLFAPVGTGMLYVRREKIRDLWALMPPPEGMEEDIRKFEEIGTHPAAPALAIADALTFHEGLGAERKAARLRYLRDLWARRLREHDRVRLLTSLDPRFSCGIATFHIEGVDEVALVEHLWHRHRILTTAIQHEEVRGVRVSPSVYTTPEELDRFSEAVTAVLRDGLPA